MCHFGAGLQSVLYQLHNRGICTVKIIDHYCTWNKTICNPAPTRGFVVIITLVRKKVSQCDSSSWRVESTSTFIASYSACWIIAMKFYCIQGRSFFGDQWYVMISLWMYLVLSQTHHNIASVLKYWAPQAVCSEISIVMVSMPWL